MRNIIPAMAFAAAVVCGFMTVQSANAAALYFEKVGVQTSSEKTCLSFASDVARSQGFRNVHKNPLEVAGVKDGAYVSITCVGRGQQPAIAIVMSAADSFEVARQAGHSASDQVKRIVCFDSPC